MHASKLAGQLKALLRSNTAPKYFKTRTPTLLLKGIIIVILYIKKILLIVSLLFIQVSYALPSNEKRAVIITPFIFLEGAAPQNVLDEMNMDRDLPKILFDYFQRENTFMNVLLEDEPTDVDVDIYIKGEILHVAGGNGAARFWSGYSSAGTSAVAVGIKVYDKAGQLLNQGVATQNGARGGSLFTVVSTFSNKKNIATAMNAIPQKILIAALGGDLTTANGVVRAIKSNNPILIQAGAKQSNNNDLFLNESVTDSMEEVLLKTVDGNIKNKHYIDGAAWCAINLAGSSNIKYVATLEKVVASKAHKKIKKHATNALRQLTESAL
jgi:hypothetical protein